MYDEIKHKDIYPKVGQKLNKPALVTFNNVDPKGRTLEDKIAKLKRQSEQFKEVCTHHFTFN